jgi:hypothetical protein
MIFFELAYAFFAFLSIFIIDGVNLKLKKSWANRVAVGGITAVILVAVYVGAIHNFQAYRLSGILSAAVFLGIGFLFQQKGAEKEATIGMAILGLILATSIFGSQLRTDESRCR